ncbi:MFS transporter [Streptomyces sp. SCL15-6]|uniref:MFS transporter n=1 Tax=Streptomyces sp. SCL15-6 TaxID=2967222 RepID=UPI0029662209|nr:MFS transporter [Streptomyces sp. SCL15-6]
MAELNQASTASAAVTAGPGADIEASPPPAAPRSRATLLTTSAITAVALMIYTAPMVTLPETAAALKTPLSAQAWLLNGTPLGLAALLLVAGSLADDYGRRRLFVSGTIALGLTTVAGAFVTTTGWFVAARIVQGVASAAILASSLGLIVHAFPESSARRHATGVWGACVSGGIAVGPLIAGVMPSWRVAYGVLGVAALLLAAFGARSLTESRSPHGGRPDVFGAAVFSLALGALVAALTLGRDGWLRTPVVLLLGTAVVLTACFVVIERRGRNPMIELGLLRHPRFLVSLTGGLSTGLAVIGLFSYMPSLLQRSMALSAIGTAWLLMLWSGLSFLTALQVRRLATRITSRHQLALGFLLHAVGALALLGSIAAHSWTRLLPGLIVAGIGSGLLNAALPLISVESVPSSKAAMGSGAQQTLRYIGSCAGVAMTIAIVTSARSAAHGADLAVIVSAVLSVLTALLVSVLKD